MRSTSASTKMKAILVIDIIIVALATTTFLYVDALPGPALSTQQIQLVNLQVTPNNPLVGQSTVVSVNATNSAGQKGTYSTELFLDSVLTKTITIELASGETKTVQSTISQASEGTHIVKIGTLEGSFIVRSIFKLSDLAINRTEAGVGEPLGISAKITNRANQTSNYSLTLVINNASVQTKTGQLEAGANSNVLFEIAEQIEGIYQFTIGSLNGTFKIISNALPPKPAEFQVANLTIDPEIAAPSQTVNVTAKITNVGELSGSYTVELAVNEQTKDTKTIQLAGGETETVFFTVTQSAKGTYNIKIGTERGTLQVQDPPKITLTNMIVNPDEVWGGDNVTVIINGKNTGNTSSLLLKLSVNGETVESKPLALAAGTEGSAEFTIAAPQLPGGDSLFYPVEVNGLSGGFTVSKTGFHTLSVAISPLGYANFNLTLPNGQIEQHQTPWSALLPVGNYSVTLPATDPEGTATWISWEDGSTSLARTITLTNKIAVTGKFNSGSSCPSLYFWNGTSYVYVADVSNDGWLGYTGYMTQNGSIVFLGGNPWDHAKLDKDQIQPIEIGNSSYYSVKLVQNWNELFYLDAAYMVVVDHPSNTNVHAPLMNYLNPVFNNQIYTVSKNNLKTPISAVNEKGENVLPQISNIDGVFTPGNNGPASSPTWNNLTWNQLTLDLGDLSNAKQIKLVINGMVDWGAAQGYYDWIAKFKAASAEGLVPNGTQITPPPYLEVKNSAGQWIRVPENIQMPIPADYVSRTFVVDLTGIFPSNVSHYQIRLNNFWNVTYDYIGIDTSQQKPISIQRINPSANLNQAFTSLSTASGNFTRYGNVTELLLNADDKFVIGRQGDEVSLLFSSSGLLPPSKGMERDYFVYVACWFKDPPNNWGYGFNYAVKPLPFQGMRGFPYPPTESYPNDYAHLKYLSEWNTRVIDAPSIRTQTFGPSPATWGAAVAVLLLFTDAGFLFYHKKRIR